MSPQEARLEAFTELLLDRSPPPGDQLGAAQSLYDLLIELADWDADALDSDRETQVSAGVAISPLAAARCVLDSRRTASFLRGVEFAIREMQRRRPTGPVEFLYAGCGPLAPLLLPLAGRYAADELQITLLDIHEASLTSACGLFETLGLRDRVRACVVGDALHFQPPVGQTWDVVVVEMLQMALGKEPQVAVTERVTESLVADGILVPERISVRAALADLSTEFSLSPAPEDGGASSVPPVERRRLGLGTILELDRESAPKLLAAALDADNTDGPQLPGVILHVPEAVPENCHTPILRTTIQVAPSIVLEDYDSGLTVPRTVHSLGRVMPGERLEFWYRLGERPGFDARRVD